MAGRMPQCLKAAVCMPRPLSSLLPAQRSFPMTKGTALPSMLLTAVVGAGLHVQVVPMTTSRPSSTRGAGKPCRLGTLTLTIQGMLQAYGPPGAIWTKSCFPIIAQNIVDRIKIERVLSKLNPGQAGHLPRATGEKTQKVTRALSSEGAARMSPSRPKAAAWGL